MTTTRWKVDKWTNGQVCITSKRGLICTMESGNDETRKSDAAQIVREHNAMLVLESLTPGGSEYAGDPEACAKYLRWIKSDAVTTSKQLVTVRRQLTARAEAFEAMREALKAADLFLQRFEDERGSCESETHSQVKAALRQAKGG